MGWSPKKAYKKAREGVKKWTKSAGRKYGAALTGGLWQPGMKDYRSAAAGGAEPKKVEKEVKRQGGAGQVKYTGEFYE